MTDPIARAAQGGEDGAAAHAFGRRVLGPILAEFAVRLWLFQRVMPRREEACLLFCARGGLRLHLVYARVLARTGLPALLPAADLMVSRLVAARTVMPVPTASLLDEVGREFAGRPMREVAAALAQVGDLGLGPAWDAPFDREAFARLVGEPEAARLREAVQVQDQAFRRHLAAATGERSTAVLCDTGLYGSTLRLLRDGVPAHRWVAVHFARCNYKGYPAPHFAATVGLCVERDGYAPWNARTGVLRFWHLIEAMLEPDLPSVRVFTDGPLPRANLEREGWRDAVPPTRPGLFSGALAHLDTLGPGDLARVGPEAEAAWRRLRRAVTRPGPREVAALAVADRSRDFGRAETVPAFGTGAAPIRASLWREGALRQRHPRFAAPALALLELGHAGRAVLREAGSARAAPAPDPASPLLPLGSVP
ncbi:glycosyltransferase [Methylobacterium sp. JK268]